MGTFFLVSNIKYFVLFADVALRRLNAAVNIRARQFVIELYVH